MATKKPTAERVMEGIQDIIFDSEENKQKAEKIVQGIQEIKPKAEKVVKGIQENKQKAEKVVQGIQEKISRWRVCDSRGADRQQDGFGKQRYKVVCRDDKRQEFPFRLSGLRGECG